MNRTELEDILFKSASSLMKKEGEKIFQKGFVSDLKGKKIQDIYHIYGRVKSETNFKEFSTHIKINLEKKKLEGAECSCEEFKEFTASGYSFMCSHLTATSYRFISSVSKKNAKREEEGKAQPVDLSQRKEESSIYKLVRKVSKENITFESQVEGSSEKVILQQNKLRDFLKQIESKKIRFKYDYIEFTVPIYERELPIVFTVKERGKAFVLTTQKQLPIPLNSNHDVYFFKNTLYLPPKSQIDKYDLLYERLKEKSEILYRKDLKVYHQLMTLLSSISREIIVSEEVRSFVENIIKPEFLLYEEGERIFCDVTVDYGDERINILREKDRGRLVRDYKKEEKILMDAEKYMFIKRDERLLFIGGDEELFQLLTKRGDSLHSLGKVTFGNGLRERKIFGTASMNAVIEEREEFYNFSYGIENIEPRELNSIFNAYKARSRFYKTKDNGFIDLEDEGVQGFFHLIDGLNIEGRIDEGYIQVEKGKAFYLNESIRQHRLDFIKGVEGLEEIEERLINIQNRRITVPKDFKGTLRKYQVSGFKWFKCLSELGFGGLLADEMGLGKTIQTIVFLLSEEEKNSIIICPTSLIYNWKDELEKFAPSLKIGVIHGEKTERKQIFQNIYEFNVILTTYGTLRMDIELYRDIMFDYCILDEGQNIKNAVAQNTRVAKEVKAKVRFALTGTPIENNLTELWSIFDFIMPGYLYTNEEFEQKFITYKEENIDNLKLLIKPFLLRRTKKQVMMELPDKIEKKLLVEMTAAQKDVYKSYIHNVREIIKNNKEGKIEVFSYLTRLRQICLDPSLILEEYEGGSGKLNVALDLIEAHIETEGKVLLFSQFTSVLDKIGERLKEAGIAFFHLDGSTKPKERIQMVREFNESEEIRVFLISLKAGGTGLNLTSANLVIHFDPWWNPAVEDQATDRAHRIGQKDIVEVVKLIAKGTIEEKIVSLQENKKELIDLILTADLQNSNILNKLSKEELLQLFTRD